MSVQQSYSFETTTESIIPLYFKVIHTIYHCYYYVFRDQYNNTHTHTHLLICYPYLSVKAYIMQSPQFMFLLQPGLVRSLSAINQRLEPLYAVCPGELIMSSTGRRGLDLITGTKWEQIGSRFYKAPPLPLPLSALKGLCYAEPESINYVPPPP